VGLIVSIALGQGPNSVQLSLRLPRRDYFDVPLQA